MKYVDRIIWAAVVVVIGAIAIPAAVPELVTLAVAATACFIAIRLAIYFTSERW